MTADLLVSLNATHALNPTPVGDDVVRFYVEFDELVGARDTEAALRRAVEGGRRVAVVGASGVGKSSLIEWVLGAPDEGYASIRIPVAVEHDSTITDPQAFAQHAIRTVSKYALDADLISPDQRRKVLIASSDRLSRPGREITGRSGLGVPSWLLRGDIGREVKAYVEAVDQTRSGAAIVDALFHLVDLIAHHDLRAVFIIDDSDPWLSIDGVKDRSRLVNGFFDRVIRMLAELPSGLVVAVHEEYLAMPGYRQAAGFLETMIRVPRLPSERALARVLEHRVTLVDPDARIGDVFDRGAIAELYGYYRGAARGSLRKVMQSAQTSVQIAAESGAELVVEAAVEAAASDWA